LIITYRNIIAFLDENKVITIYINKYGEQYFDILALAVIWFVCLIGLFFLVKTLREEILLNEENYKFQKKPLLDKENSFFDLNSNINLNNKKTMFIGYLSKSHSNVKRKFKEKE